MISLDDCEIVSPVESAKERVFKLIIIGEPSVGKSCMLVRAVKGEFREEYDVTLGAEFGSLYVRVGEKIIQLQIWDTAGMEKFRSIIRVFFNGSLGAFLVYDLTRKSTFEALDGWLQMLRDNASPNVKVVLVANKKDQEAQREVSAALGQHYADSHSLLDFVETSAKTGENILRSFMKMAKLLCHEYIFRTTLSNDRLRNKKPVKKKGCC